MTEKDNTSLSAAEYAYNLDNAHRDLDLQAAFGIAGLVFAGLGLVGNADWSTAMSGLLIGSQLASIVASMSRINDVIGAEEIWKSDNTDALPGLTPTEDETYLSNAMLGIFPAATTAIISTEFNSIPTGISLFFFASLVYGSLTLYKYLERRGLV